MAAPRVDRGRLAVDGQFWGLSRRRSATLLAIPFAGAALLGLTALVAPLYDALVREDSLLEWLQVASYLAAFLLAGRSALGLHGWVAAAFGVFALGCLVAAGEEVSWGQRLFGIDTPDGLEGLNNQEELNVHDVVEVQGKLNLAVALASLYGLAAPWLVRRRVLVAPPIALGGAFLAMLAYTAARAAFFPHPGHALAKYSEWPETCFAAALAVFALLVWRRTRAAE
jgi:hypothetical protein